MVENNINNIAEKVRDDGYYVINDILNESDSEKIKNIISKYKIKNQFRHFFVNTFKFKMIEVLKLKFKKFSDVNYLIKLSKRLHLNDISNEILKKKTVLQRIDFTTHDVSNDPVVDWHVDCAFSGQKNDPKKYYHPQDFAIKFFFYLSDVDNQNGCLSYIPGSHEIGFAFKKGLYEKKFKYSPYWSLDDFVNNVQNNYKYVSNIVGEKKINNFFQNCEIVKKEKRFDLPVKARGAVIFDEGGIHKGNQTLKTKRIALRYFYKEKQFV